MKKRLIILSALIVVSLTAILLLFGLREEKETSVKSSGIIDGPEVTLSAKLPGRIMEICCREGDPVRKGQVVVRLEAEDLKASVRQAEAAVQRARADLSAAEAGRRNAEAALKNAGAEIRVAEADAESARAKMEEAGKELRRVEALFRERLVSESLYDRTVTQHRTAVAAHSSENARLAAAVSRRDAAAAGLSSAVSQIGSAQARLKEAEASLAFAQSRLEDTVITSPVSGAVIFRGMENGEYASPGVAIMTIVDTSGLYARVDIEETRIGRIRLGGEALIRVEALPGRVFRGKVSEIGRYGEFATQRDVVRGRQDIRTFRVKVRPDDPEGLLKPGITVDVEIPY